ncbi:MAG: polynucleotide adenylyltransferase PcnB [Pseudomonadota bacterium]|nr:polynucleotide adenylyltransferase PcnB [Pseudomonadota bacterium]
MEIRKKNIPEYFGSSRHEIDISKISNCANFVVKQLQSSGYEAFLVGGCVRDLILKNEPHDFDVVTDAKPRDILKIFGRKSRPIGKRFKIVHVKINNEVIEVSTFRKAPKKVRVSRVKKNFVNGDNEFGSISDDVLRRDFTVNALYFDIKKNLVIDYLGGFQDIKRKKLSCIGPASDRFQEDPMRILRAIRFSATLKFELKNLTFDELSQHGYLLDNLSSARLFYELEKLFLRGSASDIFNELVDLNLVHYLFPVLNKHRTKLSNYQSSLKIIKVALQTTDKRVTMGYSVTLAFLCAVFLWNGLKMEIGQLRCEIVNESKIFEIATERIISRQIRTTAIPRRISNIIREIWRLQFFFENPTSKSAYRLLQNNRLRAGYNFFVLRSKTELSLFQAVEWWRKFFSNALKNNELPFPESDTYRL